MLSASRRLSGRAAPRRHFRECCCAALDFRLRRRLADRNPERTLAGIVAHGGQDVTLPDLSGRAGRARRQGDALEIESDLPGLGFQPRKRERTGICQAGLVRPVDHHIGGRRTAFPPRSRRASAAMAAMRPSIFPAAARAAAAKPARRGCILGPRNDGPSPVRRRESVEKAS